MPVLVAHNIARFQGVKESLESLSKIVSDHSEILSNYQQSNQESVNR